MCYVPQVTQHQLTFIDVQQDEVILAPTDWPSLLCPELWAGESYGQCADLARPPGHSFGWYEV